MQYKRMSNQADVGDMVRDDSGNMFLVVGVDFATVDGEVKKNETPYTVINIETGKWQNSYESLYDLNYDYSLEARSDNMVVYY